MRVSEGEYRYETDVNDNRYRLEVKQEILKEKVLKASAQDSAKGGHLL